MISEAGYFLLSLAFVAAIFQGLSAFLSFNPRFRSFGRMVDGLSVMGCVAIVLSFFCLVSLFVMSDFSVANVANHSHSNKPLIYKISAAWGSHEGSMLLWNLMVVGFGAFMSLKGAGIEPELKRLSLGIQGVLGAAFIGFTLFTSNPFVRSAQVIFEGKSLTPALQDPLLAIHPPFLYIGYVGCSAVFSFGLAALILGRFDRQSARHFAQTVRPYALSAWSFLTIGILLGAFWAYYQLGWGGWWAWDPVENASFLPWLSLTAFIHSLRVMQNRDGLKGWTLFLALLTFGLSMLGAFLVRSGVLTSVHAFAVDPSRGIWLLIILFVALGVGFSVFSWRNDRFRGSMSLSHINKDAAILANNLIFMAGLLSVFLGTLYPLLVQALFNEAISVGPPYFNLVFAPIMSLGLIILPVAVRLTSKQADAKALWNALWPVIAVSFSLSLIIAVVFAPSDVATRLIMFIGTGLGIYVVLGILGTLKIDFKNKDLKGFFKRPLSFHGQWLAHVGLGIFVLGAVIDHSARTTQQAILGEGESFRVSSYVLRLETVGLEKGKNFDAEIGTFTAFNQDNKPVCTLKAARRFYPDSLEIINKVGLCFLPIDDLYIVMSEPVASEKKQYNVRAYLNPAIRLVFLGPLLMALGGLLAAFSQTRPREN